MTFTRLTSSAVSQRTHRTVRRCALGAAVLLMALTAVACGSSASDAAAGFNASQRTCVAGVTRSTLATFESLVGFSVHCADIYDDAATTWSAWDDPYFTHINIAADNWTSFAADSSNRLIITLSLIPDSVTSTDWRARGAAGQYTSYARTLAQNLINAHMGHAVIRLATEANGTWEKDSIGNTPKELKLWAQFWRKTAVAMNSVSGAHFSFDWCINNGYRPIPFRDYYPGNSVVDSIGVDVYDTAPKGTQNRFGYVDSEPGGLKAIAAFAKAQHKPLTIPEWGILPPADKGIGDDPSFVRGIANFVASTPVISQSYFFDENSASTLAHSAASLKLYKSAFNPKSGSVISKQ